MNFLEQYRLPSWRLLLAFWGVFCVVFISVFYLYPGAIGSAVAWGLDIFSVPAFLAHHPAVYAGVKGLLSFVYMLAAVGTLDFLLCLFIYKLLDLLVTRQGSWGGLAAVSWRATLRLLGVQCLAGVWLCIAFWKVPSFSALSLLPALFTASMENAFLSAVWQVFSVLFACAFAITEDMRRSFSFGWKLFKARYFFWIVFFAGSFLITWFPAYIAVKIGVTGGTALATVWFIIYGASNHILLLSVLLTYLFNQPDVFALEDAA